MPESEEVAKDLIDAPASTPPASAVTVDEPGGVPNIAEAHKRIDDHDTAIGELRETLTRIEGLVQAGVQPILNPGPMDGGPDSTPRKTPWIHRRIGG